MLKSASSLPHKAKQGSLKNDYQGPLASGLNRRAFLKTSTAIALLAGLPACKPTQDVTKSNNNPAPSATTNKDIPASVFSDYQKKVLAQVQMQLLPDDGDGPSAQDINGVDYLEWAMTDQQNIQDGDPDFIRKGIGWLDDLAVQTKGEVFIQLDQTNQHNIIEKIAGSSAGENWLSLLMYYLTEALLLDPVYGGNPDQIGWNWLEHQAGFPRPTSETTYRDFE